MHGAGHWVALRVVAQRRHRVRAADPERLDPGRRLGDSSSGSASTSCSSSATPSPGRCSTSSAPARTTCPASTCCMSGGAAAVGPAASRSCSSHLPTLMIVDGLGSSEAGGQLAHVSTGADASTGHVPRPARQPRAVGRPARGSSTPGDAELGWLAKSGRLALGYLGDAAKTARTYPVVDGVRYAVPGDRARWRADGDDRAARPRLRDDQLRRREDLRRGGRAGRQGPPRRVRLRGRRPAERALGQRGRRHRAPARRRRGHRRRRCSPTPPATSPATSCPRRSSSSTRSSARRRARPTTAGPARSPHDG